MKEKPPNIALIVLDSLRYDVAVATPTPCLDRILEEAQAGTWRRCYAQGTYTLPSTVSMLHAGFLPDDRGSDEPIYNRSIQGAFRCQNDLYGKEALYELPDAPSVVEGFKAEGYHTVGVGGVGWFDNRTKAAKLWEKYFDLFYWEEGFHESNPDAFNAQVGCLYRQELRHRDNPLFLFLNVPATHRPYRGDLCTPEAQGEALQYVDSLFDDLLTALPTPLHVFLCADHGECFGEDGLWGHGFYHPKVMEVPFVHFLMGGER